MGLHFYVGTFTGGFMGGEPSEGIYAGELADDGAMAYHQVVDGMISPSFLARHPSLPILYAVERAWSDDDDSSGAFVSFAINERSGDLERIDRRRSGGAFPAHVSVDPHGRFAYVANPRSGSAAAIALDQAGVPGEVTATVRHVGHGPHQRQAGPWTHSAYPDPEGKRMLACELGLDRVFVYDLDAQSGALTPAPQAFAQVSSGAGARHLAFAPSGRFVYVLNELDSTVSVFSYDPATGALMIVETRSTLDRRLDIKSSTAEIVVEPEGRFLYASNRGQATIAVFEIDPASGRLGSLRCFDSGGATPRHFAITPDGGMLLTANQHGSNVTSFFRDRQTGVLTPTGHAVHTPSPTCIVFAATATGR